MKNILITISGPSTVGKSTLTSLLSDHDYKNIVTTTTRPPRSGEINGVHYNFVSEEEFNTMISINKLVEHNTVGKYKYGVSKDAILKTINESSAMLVIEPYGANNVYDFCKENNIEILKIFLDNPMDILIKRLQERKESDNNAKEEVYKERLWSIVFIEPKEWTQKAYNKEHYYDCIFETFNETNKNEITCKILNEIKKKLNLQQKTIKP